MCASGDKSPEDPTEPFSGIQGVTSLLSSSTNFSTTILLAPEYPFAKFTALNRTTPLAISIGKGFPTLQEWLITIFFCNWPVCSLEILTSANFPNPVVIP